MGLLRTMEQGRQRAKAAASATVVSQVPGFKVWNGRYPPRDPRTRAELWSYRSWVYIAVNVIANRIANVPLRMFDVRQLADGTEDRTPIVAHPLYDTLRSGGTTHPNPTIHAFNFKRMTAMDLDLMGNAFWLKVRDAFGIPREYWRLRPDRIVAILAKDTGLIEGWAWLGRSQGETKLYLANDVVHFKYPSPVEDPYWGWSPLRSVAYEYDADQANHLYQTKFFESGAQVGFVIAAKGEVDQDTAQFILDQFNAKHQGLENMWQPVVVGGDATILPAQALNKDIQSLELWDKTRDILLATYGVPLTKAGLANDVNLSNAEALDVTFNKETILPRLTNLEEQIEMSVLPDFPQPPAGRWLDFAFDNPVPGDREFELEEDRVMVSMGARTVDEVRQKRGDKPFESGYGGKVQLSMGVTLVDPTGEGEEDAPAAPAEPKPPKAPGGKDGKDAGDEEDDTGEPRAARRDGQDWAAAVARYLKLVEPRIQGIDRTTWDQLAASLAEGVGAGESLDDLAGRVRDVFDEADTVRAQLIARTEVLGASNAGALAGYESLDIGGKGWLATRDDRTRDAHAEADGQIVGLTESFAVGGEMLQYPGDPAGSPENVCNCRCTVVPEDTARAAHRWTEAQRADLWRAYDDRLKRYEGQLAASCREVFRGQLRSVLRVLAKTKNPKTVDPATVVHAGLGAHEGRMLAAVAGVVARCLPAEADVGAAQAHQLKGE